MMPKKKKNGSRSDSPEKPLTLQLGFPRSSPSQYGSSSVSKWGDRQGRGQSGLSHVPDKTEQDQRFQQLQDMFQGQVDADVVYVILSECDWKVEDAVEKLLELTLPAPHTSHQGPTLKTVASTITSSTKMASDQNPHLPSHRPDLGLNLRSRLPSVQSNDPTLSGGLPMLSPRTPSIAGPDFPQFPQNAEKEDSIQVALEALDSYANQDLSSYISSFQNPSVYRNNLFESTLDIGNTQNNTFDTFCLPTASHGSTGLNCPTDSGLEQFGGIPSFSSQTDSLQNQESVPYANLGGLNIYSQTFQPIQTLSSPVLPTSTFITSTSSHQESVSPRTAFNNALLGDAMLPDAGHRRPVREDSKDSATSEVSRVSDVSHASEESVVDLSPGLVPKRHHRQVLRRQNISLDPQERASLEQLIEEVLIGGVDDGVMDSDDSSDDDDEDYGEGQKSKKKLRSEDGREVTPSQLKVAAKHMKNLPPRFLKRLQATQPNGGSGEEDFEGEAIDIEESLKVEEKKKPKKRTKHLLDSLDQYVEDDVPVTDPESEEGDGAAEPVESPGAASGYAQNLPVTTVPANGASMALPPQAPVSPTIPTFKNPQQPIILRPNVMNYTDLDPERVVHTPPRLPLQHQGFQTQSRDHTPEPGPHFDSQQAQRFSLDAPEFVPRSFNPIHPPTTRPVSSPVSHLRETFIAPGAFNYTPRSGSPYTVHSGSPYQGRSGSPYHLGLSSNLSPQMARRTMTASPIAMMQVAPHGRHSPIPPAFLIPKAPATATAAATAAALHGHAGLMPYAGYHVPHFQVHPSNLRYAVPAGYRPPFMPPTTAAPRMVHHAFKFSPKDRLQNSSRPSSAPTVAPGASTSPRMAANLQHSTVQPGTEKHTTPFQKVFGKPINGELTGSKKLDKDGKEAKNLSTQGSRTSKSSVEDDLSPQERVNMILSGGAKLMVILRGVPGSGKTHLAKELIHDGLILSTDDFFVTSAGYEFDYARIGEAHEWNQKRAKQALQEGKNPIIIDNTNTQAWEMKAYVLLAVKHDYVVEIMEPDTPWKFRAKELAKRNKHGVTKEFIQRMIDRFDHSVTVDSIIASSDKIKVEVEKKQRIAAQQTNQEALPPGQEGQPTEERKTKKKTRRGKGRKKKARLKELREAEANKEREKTGDEASSEEESTAEGDRSVEKASVEGAATSSGEITIVNNQSSENIKEEEKETAKSNLSPRPGGIISEGADKEDQSTPEKKLQTDLVSKVNGEEGSTAQEESKVAVNSHVSDESDSSRDSISSPSTAEFQLSQESETEATCALPSTDAHQDINASKEDVEDLNRDQQLLSLVMNSLEMNLHAMLQTKQGPAKVQLKKLLAKYQTSSEVREEIKEIIKEKMFEGMVNREVEEITSAAPSLQPDDPRTAVQQPATHPKNLTETDVNSIMAMLGQITNVDSESDNDSNNNQDKASEESAANSDIRLRKSANDTTSESKRAREFSNSSSARDLSSVESAYWQTDRQAPDQYMVGNVSAKPRTKSQTSYSDSNSNEGTWESRPKARRERKRPYKKPKIRSDEFWNVSSDKQDESLDSANSSLVSSEPGTPSTPEDGVRSRRLSGRSRLAAQFPMPELDPNEKHQLLIKDWQLPDFSAHEVPFSPPAPKAQIPTLDAETYTHPKDFAAIHRLMQQQGTPQARTRVADEGFLAIRDTIPRVIYEGSKEGEEDEQKTGIAQRLMIHRSCSTRELEEVARPDGLIFLKSCFSSVSEDDLAEILERCEGDVEWAANILLDAGYEYNEKPVQFQTGLAQAPVQITPPASEKVMNRTSALTDPQICSPPTLTQLCHQRLQPTDTFTEKVQEKFVESSLQRLNSITEFKRQRSSTSTTEITSPQQQWSETSIGSLDVFPASPGADVFHSLPETPVYPVSMHSTSPLGEPIVKPGQSQENSQVGATGLQSDCAHVDEMTLTLSPALAKQLITLFGPVGFHISGDSLSPEDLVVKLTRKTAKQIHRRWALTLQDTFNHEEAAIQSMIQQDEALAKQIQAEEEEKHKAELQKAQERSTASKENQGPPESLKEIMEEQMAIELSKKEYEKLTDLSGGGQELAGSLATKMKRQKLIQMFPTVDQSALEEVYKASGYNMTKTVSAIKASFGVNEPVQNVWTPEAVQAYEEMLVRQAVNLSLRDEWLGADEQEEADPVDAIQDPQYQDLRAEASAHYRLRHECFQKAQEAYRRGLKAVASFYSQQGHLHTQKLKEANRRAAMKIVELRNQDVGQSNTIDLHGLHVDETISILSEIIAQQERELRQRPDKRREHLYVVTGRGTHSRGGKAKIRPAVIDYLTRKNYSFSEGIPGMLKVQMKYRDDL